MVEPTTLTSEILSTTTDDCWGPQCPSWGPMSPTNFGGPNYQFPDQQRLFVLISGTFRLIIGILGLPMNAFLAFITLKNKELWTTSGILLAIVALCDAIVSSSPFISFYFAITGNIAVPQTTCFHTMSPAILAFSFMYPLLFALGVDRFLSIALPLWHRKQLKKFYILICMIPSVIVSLYVYISGLFNAYTSSSLPIRFQCNVENNFVGPYGNVVGKISLGFSVMIIACYLLLFGFIKFVYKATHKNSQETAQKIVKSLTVIVMIYLAGWVTTQIIKYNQQFFLPPNLLSQVLSTTSGAIIALTEMITAPVLYLTSKMYRKIMQKSLERLNCATYKFGLNYQASIKVQPMHSVHISRHPTTIALAKKSNNNFNLCLASIS